MSPEYLIKQEDDNTWTISKWEGGDTPSQVYTMKQDKRGALHCSCPSGRYRGWCKHTQLIRTYQKGEEDGA